MFSNYMNEEPQLVAVGFFSFGPLVSSYAWNKWVFGYNSLKNMDYSNSGTQSGFPE